MTDTITRADTTAAAEDAAEATVRVAPAAARECVDVDPTTLIIGDNVRAEAHLDRQFLASLREFGVMDPIHVTRAEDGTLTVRRGQRRTLGAVRVGRPTVPVLVVGDDDSEAERITKQWHENERRAALTDTDRLAAVEQLTILGVPAGSIAKRLGTPKKVIDAAVQANTSDLAKAAASKHALTLTDAALIAEFEENEQVVRDILSAVKDGYSAEHIAQQARDDKARQQAYDEAVTALVEAGVTVIGRPDYDEKVITGLRDIRLLNKDGSAKMKAPTVDEHATCPGHAAYVSQGYGDPHPTYVCTNPKENKHALYSWKGTTLPTQATRGGMTDEQKAERRTLIENNKQWDSAETVRRAWLSEAFLTRTSPPKGAETFLAVAVAHGEHTEDGHALYTRLTTGTDDTAPWETSGKIAARAAAATPRQVLMLALALLVCEWESTTSRNTWRSPKERDRRYLSALIGWGYKPSDVERLVLVEPVEPEATATKDTEPVEDVHVEPVEDGSVESVEDVDAEDEPLVDVDVEPVEDAS